MKHLLSVLVVVLGLQLAQAQDEGTRQVHLDFHTSEYITEIGEKFDKKQFQEALKLGKVNSINVFAKGHHGWSYYDTKAGNKHPHLSFDLLKAQIEACHEIGVRVQAYFAIGWSQNDYAEHPEWAVINKEGKTYCQINTPLPQINAGDHNESLPYTFWTLLSPEGTYKDLILKQTEELLKNYDLDGYWFDLIPMDGPNYSPASIADMKKNGVNPDNEAEALEHHKKKMQQFFDETNTLIEKHKPNASIFYNWSTSFRFTNVINDTLYQYNTKQDLEDLPTTWDGYDVFPMRAKFFNPLDKPVVAMSGKFHTAWGEFGGFKNKDALWYEAASMVAFGARANFGDQLHPSGVMEPETYKNIGYAFDYVQKIEDYGVESEDVANLGVLLSFKKPSDEGTVRMLLEEQLDFVIVNHIKDWSNLETLILNDGVALSSEQQQKVDAFIERGGKLLIMGDGTLDRDTAQFTVDFGADYVGPANYDIDYTLVGDAIAKNLPRSPYLNYVPATRVAAKAGTKVLGHIHEPYFSRTLKHYSSHRNTPYKMEKATHPSVIQKGNMVYVAHPLGEQYFEVGAKVHRDIFRNALDLVHTKPMVRTDLPSAGRVNLLHQPQKNRYVAHLLYAVPIQRGIAQIIEDIVPLHNIDLEINVPKKVKKCYTVPNKKSVKFRQKGNKVQVTVPKMKGHIGVVFEY
ncbi:alpha-L-fucosidase [Maribacter sp. 2304DJ31-5]|uniref:alpha-L-fucosidase n=1 Tax=Maribacter sp. 2304DJ31-5 TaxID=3386273 RepID=UPI0039BD6545